MEIETGKQKSAWLTLLYGVPGIGKSTWASLAPDPIFINIENGLKRVDCKKTPHITSWALFKEGLNAAIEAKPQTIVIDTADALEQILAEKIIEDDGEGKSSLSDFGFGKGYDALAGQWSLVLKMLNKVVNDLGINVLLVAHDQIQKFEDPAGDSYDRYNVNLHKKTGALLIGACDAVLFAKYKAHTTKREGGFTKDKKRAISTGQRILHTEDGAAWVGKNRFGLPPQLEMTPEVFTHMI